MPSLTNKHRQQYSAVMADEKKPPGSEGSLGTSFTKAFEELAQREDWKGLIAKLMEEAKPGSTLTKFFEQMKADAQKRAAETNIVDRSEANTWLKEHWPQPRKCPICSEDNWGLSPTFAHLPEGLIGKGPVGTYQPIRTIPLVVLTCRTCGNTLLLNAIVMGLLPEKAE